MNINVKNNQVELSKAEDWEVFYKNTKLPQKFDKRFVRGYFDYRFDKMMRKYLSIDEYRERKFLEIGCGASKYMVYFSKELGMKVFGSDYVMPACVLAKENLKMNGIDDGVVVLDNIMNTELEKNTFDIVFSAGLIEHFENTLSIIEKHINLLKETGTLIVRVPNMKRFTTGFVKRYAPENYSIHKLLTPNDLILYCKQLNLIPLYCDYFCTFDISLNWGAIKLNDYQKRILMKICHITVYIITAIIRILTFEVESKYFSPSILLIAKKR